MPDYQLTEAEAERILQLSKWIEADPEWRQNENGDWIAVSQSWQQNRCHLNGMRVSTPAPVTIHPFFSGIESTYGAWMWEKPITILIARMLAVFTSIVGLMQFTIMLLTNQ